MNKSKFLKRSLATLLAILMVVAMVPMSVLAADEDAPEIFVDNRRATCEGGNYSVTVYDTTDVLISWTPVAGTKMFVITRDDIDRELDTRLYLPENANFDGTDTYTLNLREEKKGADPVPHTLKIKVLSTKPDNDCTIGGVRVDKTSGKYAIGYLGNGTAVEGYSKKVENDGFAAHAIKGEIKNGKIVVTLPFGMTPADVGFNNAGIPDDAAATAVFAPNSVVARSSCSYDANNYVSQVTIKALSNATRTYDVVYVSEKVFDSFVGATNLADLENASKVQQDSTRTGGNQWSKYTLNVNVPVADPTDGTSVYSSRTDIAGGWTPEFEKTTNVQRIMGVGYEAEDVALEDKTGTKGPILAIGGTAGTTGANVEVVQTTAGGKVGTDSMLRLVTSKHATWTKATGNQFKTGDSDYVYLLVRTKANPSGAFVEVKLNPVKKALNAPRITEVQAANTMSSESAAFVPKGTTTINVSLDASYSGGGSYEKNKIKKVYLHITTEEDSIIRVHAQENDVSPVVVTPNTAAKRHVLTGVDAESKSITVTVYDKEGKQPVNYTINFNVINTIQTDLKRVALYTDKGVKVAEGNKRADGKTWEIKVPFKYFPTTTESQPTNVAVVGSSTDLEDLVWFFVPSDGATVTPGRTAGAVDATNVEVDGSKVHTCANSSSSVAPHIFENGITTVAEVWRGDFVETSAGAATGYFDGILPVTVSNAGNSTASTFNIELKRGEPLTVAEIDEVTTNRALDDDYVYAKGNSIGQERSQDDIGQAYVAAVGEDGNELPTRIEDHNIIVTVPYDWASTDSFYLTKLKKSDDTKALYRYVDDYWTTPNIKVQEAGKSVLLEAEQIDQSQTAKTIPREYLDYVNRFINLTPVNGGVQQQNVIYALSEKDYWIRYAASITDATVLGNYSTPYEVHIEYAEDTSELRLLNNVSSTSALANAKFDSDYGLIKVSVPSTTNWEDGYRHDSSKDFKLTFSKSAGALVIDLGQKQENDKLFDNTDSNYAGKATTGRYASADAATLDKYHDQVNERDQITDDTWFFVLDGELYIYDELTGDEIQVTGVGGDFTNDSWAAIKTKQAEIQVYDENQNDMITYRLDLEVGPTEATSSDATLSSVKANGYSAKLSGTAYEVTVPEDTDLTAVALTITPTDSKVRSITVNGDSYTEGMTVDLSEEKSAAIVVMAEDGTIATYTLTAKTGTVTPPDPGKKPSDNYTDLPAEPMRTYVADAIDKGIISGTSSTKFTPRNNITRQDFALIVARADIVINNPELEGNGDAVLAEMISQYSGKPNFTDTEKLNDTYNAAIEYCVKKGIINGKGDGIFDPRAQITRLEAARVMSDWTKVTDETKTENTNGIKDWNNVNWGKHYVNSLYDAGILHGNPDGTFKPAGNLMRFEAAVMIMGSFDYINQSTTD